MAGHFRQAHELLDADRTGAPAGPPTPPVRAASPPRRSGRCSPRPGFGDPTLHAVRVFGDLVPSSLVDLEPGAAAALAALEQAVSTRPEYLALATQVHALARRAG